MALPKNTLFCTNEILARFYQAIFLRHFYFLLNDSFVIEEMGELSTGKCAK